MPQRCRHIHMLDALAARLGPVLLALTISAPRLGAAASETLHGISFAQDPPMLFVPVGEIASALGRAIQLDQAAAQISLTGHFLDAPYLRKLTKGTLLSPIHRL